MHAINAKSRLVVLFKYRKELRVPATSSFLQGSSIVKTKQVPKLTVLHYFGIKGL
jgi:hypothetical protein